MQYIFVLQLMFDQALARDGFRCVVTGQYDATSSSQQQRRAGTQQGASRNIPGSH